MPISINSLIPGAWYVLNCPKARTKAKRVMRFAGIRTEREIKAEAEAMGGRVFTGAGERWLADARYAVFEDFRLSGEIHYHRPDHVREPILDGDGPVLLSQCYIVTEDGLFDGEKRRVYIERRIHREN